MLILFAVIWLGAWLLVAILEIPQSGPIWADPIAIAVLVAGIAYVSSAPFRRGPVVAASQLQPGMLVRQPRRPFSARIVTRVMTINGVSYVSFFNGPDRTYEATYEASTVTFPKPRTRNWHYGRI
ncbi:MAG: hypothetical protein HQ526_07265 [Actinobacteria bacterium]|nr:hypothetical protein [Actinomycetota bacterium]